MGSLKKLNKADITRVPYAANKQWNLDYFCTPQNDPYVTIYKGTKITGSFSSEKTSIDPVTNEQYERLVYDSINHLFYKLYSGSILDTGSLMFNINTYESASQQRPTASYFDYNSNPYFINTFPTGSGAEMRVMVINQDIYGSKVLPHSFNISYPPSETFQGYDIKDDGYGNLYDISKVKDDYIDLSYLTVATVDGYFNDTTPGQGVVLVGNIFYAHGIATINHPSYQNIFDLPPLAIEDSASFQDISTSKIIDILSNDIERNGGPWVLDPSSVTLYGDNAQYYTINSNGTLTLNTTSAGQYDVYYTVKAGTEFNCILTSNKAKVTVNVFTLPPLPLCLNVSTCPNIVSPLDYLVSVLWSENI